MFVLWPSDFLYLLMSRMLAWKVGSGAVLVETFPGPCDGPLCTP